MLASRPMLSFAGALMAGVIVCRLCPGLLSAVPYGVVLFFLASAWFVATPSRRPVEPPAALPASYAEHIFPAPGFLARRGLNRFVLIAALGCFLIGAFRQKGWSRKFDADALPAAHYFDATLLALAPSHDYAGKKGAWRVPARLLTVDGKPAVAASVRLTGPAGVSFRRGDMLNARVRRVTLNEPAFPGDFDSRFWLERDGLVGTLAVARPGRGGDAAGNCRVVPVDAAGAVVLARRVVDAVRGMAIAGTLKYGGESGPVLATMLYGYYGDLAKDLRDAFFRIGIGHILSISGMHVSLVAGLSWWVVGWLNWPSRRRALICLTMLFIYLGLSGGQVAAVRATLMAAIYLSGIAWGRKSDMLNSLGVAAFLITLFNPSAPFDISFQLSFIAMVFIFLSLRRPDAAVRLSARAAARRPPSWRTKFARELDSLVRLSIYTWVGMFPIIALVFNQINLIGLPINVVVIPISSIVLVGGLLLPWLGWLPGAAWILRLPMRAMAWLAFRADAVPYSSIPSHSPGMGWTVLFYCFIFLFAVRGMVSAPRPRRIWSIAASAGIAAALVGLVASLASLPPPKGGRLAALPAWAPGVIVAESEQGGIAVIGRVGRTGLREAGWLHHLRRGGEIGVVSVGGQASGDPLSALRYHYDIAGAIEVPLVDKGVLAAPRWLPVRGAPGVEYALDRDGGGRVVWLAARVDGKSVCVASRFPPRRLETRLDDGTPGFDADLMTFGLSGTVGDPPLRRMPRGLVGLAGTRAERLPETWFRRSRFGALVVADGGVEGFAGGGWLAVTAKGDQ